MFEYEIEKEIEDGKMVRLGLDPNNKSDLLRYEHRKRQEYDTPLSHRQGPMPVFEYISGGDIVFLCIDAIKLGDKEKCEDYCRIFKNTFGTEGKDAEFWGLSTSKDKIKLDNIKKIVGRIIKHKLYE